MTAPRQGRSIGPADSSADPLDALHDLSHVLFAPTETMTGRLSALMDPWVPHVAVVSWSEGCVHAPLHAHGDESVLAGLRTADLADLADALGAQSPARMTMPIAGTDRPVLAASVAGRGGRALLVLVLDGERTGPEHADAVVQDLWTLVEGQLSARVDLGRPHDLTVTRAAAGERSRVAARLGEEHAAFLVSILRALREETLDDQAARRVATDLASQALIEVRRAVDIEQQLGDEPADAAFSRFEREMRPLVMHGVATVSFSPPHAETPLPAQVAQSARAISRTAALALLDQEGVTRLRIAWQLGDALEVIIRDDGPGGLAGEALASVETAAQVMAIEGSIEFESVSDWGTRLVIRIPLGLGAPVADDPLEVLQPREREVLDLLAAGSRNREIAEILFISQNTVKFHVGNVLRKLGVESRGQAAALVRAPATAAVGGRHHPNDV